MTISPRASSRAWPRRLSSLLSCLAALVLVLLAGMAPLDAAVTWRGMLFEYVGRTEYVYPFDSRSPKVLVRITNQAATSSPTITFQLAVVGLGSYPAPVDSGGFATFPNGGTVTLAPGESTIVSAWTGGVYEGRFNNTPPAVGTSKDYTFDFLFALNSTQPGDTDTSTALTQTVRFTNLGDNPALSGPVAAAGRVQVSGAAPQSLFVEASTSLSNWYQLGNITSDGNGFPFSYTLPNRIDWHLRFSINGGTSTMIPVGSGGSSLAATLTASAIPDLQYTLIQSITTNTGFWRGAVSESEGTFVCFPGQENWKTGATDAETRSYFEAGRVYKYTFSGTRLWEHNPGWEIWGGDMTPDGRYVAYVLNPTFRNFYTPTVFKMVLLDGLTGNVLWEKSAPTNDPTGRLMESLELALSPNGQWIAVGTTGSGVVTLFDRATSNVVWTIPGSGPGFGQVRKLKFSADGAHLYCGGGDNYLRKIDVSNGAVLWRTWIGGWPFVNGLTITQDGAYISTGTKSFDVSVVRASDGHLMWSRESGVLDAILSPDGRYVAVFGGRIYDAATGDIVGHASLGATSQWTPDSRYLMKLDRSLTVHELGGRQVRAYTASGVGLGGGEQCQWSYVTRDGRYAIELGRDMNTPPAVGIAIYERTLTSGTSAPAITSHPVGATVATGQSALLSAAGSGTAPLTYYWYRDGVHLAGESGSSLWLDEVSASDAGSYIVAVASPFGLVTTNAASVTVASASSASRLANLSVRTNAGTGDAVAILGYVIGGAGTTGNKPLLVRGIGPSLAQHGVSGVLADPVLAGFQGTTPVGGNDNWGGDPIVAAMFTQTQAFPLDPSSLDAAFYSEFAPNLYTVQLSGKAGATGVGLAELYDGTADSAFTTTTPRLLNVSARVQVGTGAEVLIAGFVITGNSSKTVLIRGIGPTLSQFGVAGVLADPQLVIYSGSTVIVTNDDWAVDSASGALLETVFTDVGAFQLSASSKDAALLVTLPPGAYTAHVIGANNTTGIGLVEVYDLAL